VVLFYLLVMGLAVVASITDVSSRIIPNWVSAAIAALFPLYVVIFASYDFAASGAAAAGLVLAVGLVLFALGWLGGGDVKLLGAIGAWVGPLKIVHIGIVVAIVGGVAAIGVSLWRGYGPTLFRNTLGLLRFWHAHGLQPHPALTLGTTTGPRLRYASVILIGTAGVLLWP